MPGSSPASPELATNGSPALSLAELAAALRNRKLPPVELWNPTYCGEMDLRIARDGLWYYQGTPIGRKELVKLFSTVLRLEPDGGFVLVTPVEKLGIVVEDAPFLAVEVTTEGQGRDRILGFRLNIDDHVVAGPDNALRFTFDAQTDAPRPYLHVRRGLEALIARPVFYELVDLAMSESAPGGELGLWSQGVYFRIGDWPKDV
jgi:uncharacterized protein